MDEASSSLAAAELPCHVCRKRDMRVREVMRLLANDGWLQTSQKGSHRQLEHPTKPGKVTVAGKMSDDLPTGTLKSILRQAGLEQ